MLLEAKIFAVISISMTSLHEQNQMVYPCRKTKKNISVSNETTTAVLNDKNLYQQNARIHATRPSRSSTCIKRSYIL